MGNDFFLHTHTKGMVIRMNQRKSSETKTISRRAAAALLVVILSAMAVMGTSCTRNGNVMTPDMDKDNGTVTEGTPSHETGPETTTK